MRLRHVICAVLAGCGGSGAHPDASAIDGAPVGTVDVAVTRAHVPLGGIRVVFENGDSTVVADMTTDATGHASATMAAGGFVSVIDPRQMGLTDVRTFAAVQPGDHLALDVPAATPHSFTVVVPASTAPGVVSYAVWTQCNPTGYAAGTVQATAVPLSAMTTTTCVPVTDVTVVALDASNHAVDALYHTGAQVTDGGTLDLSTETYSGVTSATYAFASPPPGMQSFTVLRRSASGVPVIDGDSLTMAASSEQFSLAMPSLPQATDFTTLATSGAPAFHVHAWGPVPLAPVDLAGRLPSVARTGFDVAAETLRWTVQAGGPVPDVVVGSIVVGPGSWSILAPFDPAGLAFPRLPADLASVEPTSGGAVSGVVVVGQVPGGYAGIRAHGELLEPAPPDSDPLELFPQTGALGSAGLVALELVDVGA